MVVVKVKLENVEKQRAPGDWQLNPDLCIWDIPYTSQELSVPSHEDVCKTHVLVTTITRDLHDQLCPWHTKWTPTPRTNQNNRTSYKGHLPPPGGLPHCHPCRFLRRGWETLHHSIWTCTPPEGQTQAPAVRCQTLGRHCQGPLHLCDKVEGTEHSVKHRLMVGTCTVLPASSHHTQEASSSQQE